MNHVSSIFLILLFLTLLFFVLILHTGNFVGQESISFYCAWGFTDKEDLVLVFRELTM